jgi:hypothetical protein
MIGGFLGPSGAAVALMVAVLGVAANLLFEKVSGRTPGIPSSAFLFIGAVLVMLLASSQRVTYN